MYGFKRRTRQRAVSTSAPLATQCRTTYVSCVREIKQRIAVTLL